MNNPMQENISAARQMEAVIMEAVFRKVFGSPNRLTERELFEFASQIVSTPTMIDGNCVMHITRNRDGKVLPLAEVTHTLEADGISTTYVSHIGKLDIEAGDDE